MPQTWVGRASAWIPALATLVGLIVVGLAAWVAFWYIHPGIFAPGKGAFGVLVVRLVMMAIVLAAIAFVVRILLAFRATRVTVDEESVRVQWGPSDNTLAFTDIEAALHLSATVQSGSGIYLYPRLEYLTARGHAKDFGKPDPRFTIAGARFTDDQEHRMWLAIRTAVIKAGGNIRQS